MSQTTQPIFITGGRGRLATVLERRYREAGIKTGLFSRQAAEGFRDYDYLLQPEVLQTATALLHLAWSTLPAQAEQSGSRGSDEDLALLQRILDALRRCRPAQRPLLVFFSSGGAVYGNAPGHPNREDDPCHPIGAYGRAKLAAESLLLSEGCHDNLPCAILRISNPYGYPVPKERQQGLVPHAIRCALGGQPLALWGDGSARKDFLHCSDFFSALDAVLQSRLHGVYNVCAGESHAVAEVLALVERTTGRQITLAPAPAPAWDVQDSRLDCAKLVAATGWSPSVTLVDGIRRAVADASQD